MKHVTIHVATRTGRHGVSAKRCVIRKSGANGSNTLIDARTRAAVASIEAELLLDPSAETVVLDKAVLAASCCGDGRIDSRVIAKAVYARRTKLGLEAEFDQTRDYVQHLLRNMPGVSPVGNSPWYLVNAACVELRNERRAPKTDKREWTNIVHTVCQSCFMQMPLAVPFCPDCQGDEYDEYVHDNKVVDTTLGVECDP